MVMKALLIIDMQKGSFKPYSIRHDALVTVDRINSLVEQFRKNHYLVISACSSTRISAGVELLKDKMEL